MKKNALIFSPEPYGAIFSKLMKESNFWDPVFFLGGCRNKDFVLENFPDVIFQDYIDAIKGIGTNSYKFNYEIIDEIDIDLTIPLSLLDRNDSNSKDFELKDRLEFCYNQINYWHSVLKRHNIEIVFFQEEPHQASIYILYKVAQFLNIKTPMVIRSIANLGVIPSLKFEDRNIKLIKLYNDNIKNYNSSKGLKLNPSLVQYLKNLRGEYQNVLKEHLWNQIDTYNEMFFSNKKYFLVLKKFLKKLLSKNLNFESFSINSDQKEKNKKFEKSNLSYLNFQRLKLITFFKKQILYKHYKKLSITPLYKEKYILVGLQYQPEKSTCPLGGRFNDQKLMIKYLRSVLHEDVKIYVKEHPSQFIYDFARYGESFRNLDYYKSLLKIPNVSLINMKANVFDLIDNSLFVSSVTGTICWEAVNRKKQAICFGYSWMAGCEGVFSVRNIKELRIALHKILNNKVQIDLNKVDLFAKTIFDLNFQLAVGGPTQLKHKNLSDLDNAEKLKNAIEWLEI